MSRASVWFRRSEFESAIADLDTAIKLDPQSASRNYRRRGSAFRGGDETLQSGFPTSTRA